LGGSPTPAVGWASGVERLVLLLQKQASAISTASAEVYVCCFGAAGERAGLAISEQAREALAGRARVALAVGGGKPGAQLKRADAAGARVALIVGDNEAAAGTVQVKFLREDQPQTQVARPELGDWLASLFPSPHRTT
ncbi:MAG TPA: His/Gly/Thr/Pro-type tRNA ligase C-terminal domain-containing protein, partial [Nevskiaceae bacterium]|nr:His/Gly/Thr/Pro-type tRNA ligase C-terminal domain-containing protein [Nevskiaceae bacterium]